MFFVPQFVKAQTNADHNVTIETIKKYFELERENIQLSMNKNAFMTNENIWIKGTVISKKSQLICPFTSNILVNLLDIDGKMIINQLV